MSQQKIIDLSVDLQCLELGILPVSDIGFLQFKGMTPDEVRIAKRKYRKIKRKLKKKLGRNPGRWDVIHHLRTKAWSRFFNT